eukprot:CAMPEP_0119259508 /NCGR_PEP_ID=MMETSP1329-20130426/302_1 /TAXON_ID=114041 /ORGANISM="Genus nov. species nov., Strain RCC1024" /LENGTH=221 /DNA_ID=CAMNT_0007258897 /DNA_START=103 /DNA_END=765 /DNA_ORIENTATION=+
MRLLAVALLAARARAMFDNTTTCAADSEKKCVVSSSTGGRVIDEGCCAIRERAACVKGYRYSSGSKCARSFGCKHHQTCCTLCLPGETCENESPVFGKSINCAPQWEFIAWTVGAILLLTCLVCCCVCYCAAAWRADEQQPPARGDLEMAPPLAAMAAMTQFADVEVLDTASEGSAPAAEAVKAVKVTEASLRPSRAPWHEVHWWEEEGMPPSEDGSRHGG